METTIDGKVSLKELKDNKEGQLGGLRTPKSFQQGNDQFSLNSEAYRTYCSLIHFGKVLHASNYYLGNLYKSMAAASDLSSKGAEEEQEFVRKVIDATFRDYNMPQGQRASLTAEAPHILLQITRNKVTLLGEFWWEKEGLPGN